MKKIKFTCPHCEAKLRVPTHLAGVTAPCPKCGASITAPTDIAAAVVDPPVVRRPVAEPAPARPRPEPALASAPAGRTAATTVMEVPAAAPASERAAASSRVATPRPLPAPVSHPVVESAPPPIVAAPPPPEPTTSFFTPPPPSRPFPVPAADTDERSEPPAALAVDSDVIVEEEILVESPPPPPASQITQPIRVSTPPGDLPLPRERVRGGDPLPRLDVSLANPAPAAVSPPVEAVSPPRTRVVLPQPGATVVATAPEDFLVTAPAAMAPPVVPMSAPPAAPETVGVSRWDAELPSFEDFAELAELEVPATEVHYTTIPLPPESAPIRLDDLEIGTGEDEMAIESPLEASGEAEPESVVPPDLPMVETETAPAVFVEHPWPETETSSVPLQGTLAAPVPRREPASGLFEELPANPLHEGSFGKLFAQQSAPAAEEETPVASAPAAPAAVAPPVDPPLPPDAGDELDELFGASSGGRRKSKGPNKTVIAMIASAAIVAILASLGFVYVAKTFLGGFTPAESYQEPEGEPQTPAGPGVRPKATASPATGGTPPIVDTPAIEDPAALIRESTGAASAAGGDPEAPALSFDEKVQQAVNGGRGASIIGSTSLDLVDDPPTTFSLPKIPAAPELPAGTAAAAPAATAAPADPSSAAAPAEASPAEASPAEALTASAPPAPTGELPPSAGPSADPAAPAGVTPLAAKDPNYNPPESFPAPGPEDSTLGKTRDLIDAFLRAPDWETRAKYSYQGESLRAAMEDYHKKWTYDRYDRFSVAFYQMESDLSLGGPYWVFLVSKSDKDGGFPVIVRTEEGNLKLDWEIFSEFADRHFTRFREGRTAPPATFRLILERFSDYYGSDREAFTDLNDYLIYQVNPPYGNQNEFSEFVFVKKGTTAAKKLEPLIRLGDDPLAVIVTLDQEAFSHGVKHYVISDLVAEGWFR